MQPRLRSSSAKLVAKRTPGGRVTYHVKKKRVSPPKCAKCGSILHGLKAIRPYALRRLNKSQKRVTRPYGGNLCSKCLRSLIKARVRGE